MAVQFLITRKETEIWGGLEKALEKTTAHQLQHGNPTIHVRFAEDISDSTKIEEYLSHIRAADMAQLKGCFLFDSDIPSNIKNLVNLLKKNIKNFDEIIIPPSGTPLPLGFLVNENEEEVELSSEEQRTLILELSLAIAAHQLNIPISGFCHGGQMLWFLSGGDLARLPRVSTVEDPISDYKEHTIDAIRKGFFVDKGYELITKEPLFSETTQLDDSYSTEGDLEDTGYKYEFEHSIVMVPGEDMDETIQASAKSHLIKNLKEVEFKSLSSLNMTFIVNHAYRWIIDEYRINDDENKLQDIFDRFENCDLSIWDLEVQVFTFISEQESVGSEKWGYRFAEYVTQHPDDYIAEVLGFNEHIESAMRCAKNDTLIIRQDHPWRHIDEQPGMQTMLLVAHRAIAHYKKRTEEEKLRIYGGSSQSNTLFKVKQDVAVEKLVEDQTNDEKNQQINDLDYQENNNK